MHKMFGLLYSNIKIKVLILALGIFYSGCLSWTNEHGVKHTIIIGLGYVSQKSITGVSVSDVGGLGVTINRGMNVGLVRSKFVEIDPNSAPNAVVSIRAAPFSLSVKNANPYKTLLNPKKEARE